MMITDYGTLYDHFAIPKGANHARRWPVDDDNGNPIDVTGWSVTVTVWDNRDPTNVVKTWSTDDGNATADADGVTITTAGSESAGWTWSVGSYKAIQIGRASCRERV